MAWLSRLAAIALVLLVPACGALRQALLTVPSETGDDPAALAQASVRSSIPAIEAYYLDNSTYVGATARLLRSTYDSGLPAEVTVANVGVASYCVQAIVEDEVWRLEGPGGSVSKGRCP